MTQTHTSSHTWLAGTAVVLSFISLSEVSTGAVVLAGLQVTCIKLLTEDPRIPIITLAVKCVLCFTFKHTSSNVHRNSGQKAHKRNYYINTLERKTAAQIQGCNTGLSVLQKEKIWEQITLIMMRSLPQQTGWCIFLSQSIVGRWIHCRAPYSYWFLHWDAASKWPPDQRVHQRAAHLHRERSTKNVHSCNRE